MIWKPCTSTLLRNTRLGKCAPNQSHKPRCSPVSQWRTLGIIPRTYSLPPELSIDIIRLKHASLNVSFSCHEFSRKSALIRHTKHIILLQYEAHFGSTRSARNCPPSTELVSGTFPASTTVRRRSAIKNKQDYSANKHALYCKLRCSVAAQELKTASR